MRASMMKLLLTELQQEIAELVVRALGLDALRDQSRLLEDGRLDLARGPPEAPLVMLNYLFGRAFTILGGASEVQRSLIFKNIGASVSPTCFPRIEAMGHSKGCHTTFHLRYHIVWAPKDWKSDLAGKRVSVSVGLGGRRNGNHKKEERNNK